MRPVAHCWTCDHCGEDLAPHNGVVQWLTSGEMRIVHAGSVCNAYGDYYMPIQHYRGSVGLLRLTLLVVEPHAPQLSELLEVMRRIHVRGYETDRTKETEK